jgi:hypothetical protein
LTGILTHGWIPEMAENSQERALPNVNPSLTFVQRLGERRAAMPVDVAAALAACPFNLKVGRLPSDLVNP